MPPSKQEFVKHEAKTQGVRTSTATFNARILYRVTSLYWCSTPIQLASNVPGTAEDDGSSVQAPNIHLEDLDAVVAPGFNLA